MTQAGNAALDTAAKRPTFCGTTVTDEEWSVLTEIIATCGLSRHELARTICEGLGYFFEAEPAFPEHCERVLEDIATIYRNDDETRDMTPDARLAYHQQHSRPVMDALYEWIEKQFRERVVEPNSRLGKAFSYVKNHWQGLTRFLEVPGVPLDNNEVEQELKPSQRHRKNSLFFKTQAGADVGDVLLSMIRTAVKKVSTRCTI